MGSMIASGQLLSATLATAYAVSIGLLLGAPVGIGLAIAASFRWLNWLLDPLITMGYGIPKVALVSLFILLLGINIQTKVALVFSFVTFVYFYNARQALLEVDPNRRTALRLMGASWSSLARLLVLPSATPHLYAATRIAIPLAFGAEVFAELRIPASSGLGTLLSNYSNSLDGSGAVAVMLIVGLIGYLLDIGIGRQLIRYAESTGTGLQI
jgi:ABC-type nitrate/sulfonate/bicarbonate transport system permease component